MKFLEDESTGFSFTNLDKKTVFAFMFGGLILSTTLIDAFFNKTTIIIGDKVTNTPLLENFCSLIGDQILSKKLSKKLSNENVFNILSANNYKILEFNGREKLLGTHANHEEKTCLLYIRDDLGVRTLSMTIDEGSSNFAYYKILSLKEL